MEKANKLSSTRSLLIVSGVQPICSEVSLLADVCSVCAMLSLTEVQNVLLSLSLNHDFNISKMHLSEAATILYVMTPA
jgi:hypothetical protein